MKRFWAVLTLFAVTVLPVLADDAAPASATKIPAAEASKHYEEDLTVTGKVAQVTIREKVVFINLEHPHPNSPLTGVIFAANTNQFGNLTALKGKSVEITGKIKNFNDTPEVVLDSSNQLKVVDVPEKPAEK